MAGLIWSVLWYSAAGHNHTLLATYEFSQAAFFYFLLPPIIYNSGFNMKRKSFFTNLGNVTIFGLAVTLVCFIQYTLYAYLALQFFDFEMTKYVTDDGEPVKMKIEFTVM